jgi:hypothetical protein
VTAEASGFVASGRWIENDARPHASFFGPSDADSRGEMSGGDGARLGASCVVRVGGTASSDCTLLIALFCLRISGFTSTHGLVFEAILLYTLRQ